MKIPGQISLPKRLIVIPDYFRTNSEDFDVGANSNSGVNSVSDSGANGGYVLQPA